MRNIISVSITAIILFGLLACSGGGDKEDPKPQPGPTYATGLNYTNPTGTSYRLVKGAASTSNILILELVGPASASGLGITFSIQTDTAKAKFVKVNSSDAELAQNGNVFQLGTAPQFFKSVEDGNALLVSLAQKGSGNVRNLDGVLARVALQLQSGVTQGTTITLSATGGNILSATGNPTPITIEVGSLVAQ